LRKLKREEVLKEKRSRGSAGSPPFLVVSTDIESLFYFIYANLKRWGKLNDLPVSWSKKYFLLHQCRVVMFGSMAECVPVLFPTICL